MPSPRFLARSLAAAAGALDLCTGLALVLVPEHVLRWMHAPAVTGEALVFLRFVGAFVAAVGATYLWALRGNSLSRLRAAFEFTVFFRGAAGSYTAWALLAGQLPWVWWSVPVTDLGLVVLQLLLLPALAADE